MANSPLSPKSNCTHARSTSLPSKPHPLILEINEHLAKLEASDAASSSSSFSIKLSGLQDLHDCVEKLVQLSQTREVLVEQEKGEDELLDGSLRLLDACTAAKDALLHTKECAREVQSIMRRKRGGESMEVTVEVRKYLTSRKIVKKAIFKALGNLKVVSSNKCKISPTNKAHHQSAELVRLLKDVEVVTISILEALLNFISGPTHSKPSNWSLVSKLMHNKKVSCTQEIDENEFSKADAALQAFVFHTSSKSENFSHLQNQLEDLESVIQDFVEGLETLFRRFIKTRVALLNILNH